MAYSASTGFRYFRSLSGQGEMPTPLRIRVANSTTLRIGDAVRVNTSGFVVRAAAGNPIGGVCLGLVDNNGINVLGQGYGTGTGATLTSDDTLTTASTNQTKAVAVFAEVAVDVSGDMLWLNDADSDLAQTNLFQFFDSDASGQQITVSSASDANGQWQLMELDPEASGGATANASKGLFRIAENQFGLGIDTGTAKNAA